MTAQGERVFVAGRQVADAEHADQGFQLVRQRDHHTRGVARQRITRKAGLVMVFDRMGDGLTQAIVQGVVTAHDALQLGEFAHHVGDQIRLGQLRSLVGLSHQRYIAQLGCDGLGNRAHALHALALGAELVVIHDLAQTVHAGGERLFAVLVEEELGVGQTGAHHPLVAANHQAGVIGVDVAHHQELVGELAGGVQQREVLLVGLHGQDQALLRDVEELGLEFANQHMGALHQGCHLVQQGSIFDGFAVSTHFGCSSVQLANDVGAALCKAGNHRAIFGQSSGIGVGIGNHHGRHRSFKAMAFGLIAGVQSEGLHRHHIAAMQSHQTVRWAHKAHAGPAGQLAAALQLVAHDLGDRQLGNALQQGLLQAVHQGDSGDHAVVEQGFCLAVHGALEGRNRAGIGAQGL